MSLLDEKIRELGQKRDNPALQKLIQTTDKEELINVVKTNYSSSTFSYSWNYILLGFNEKDDCHNKRLVVVLALLKELEENSALMTTSRSNTLVHRLCMELNKFKSEDLVELCGFCLECIQSEKLTQMSWKDLLPELLNVLVERDDFLYNEVKYSGLEYKAEFISTLCMSPWSPSKITSLTSIFIDMPLTKEEHLKVVNKLGTFIEKMTPQEVPSFTYQLLKLCRHQNSRTIFLRLQNYFTLRIYNNCRILSETNSENTDIDGIESTNDQDCIEAESTVLYHIHNAASLAHECIKDYLNSLKNVIKAPEAVLNPFQLMCLFTISTVPLYEETVFEIIRPSISRTYFEEQKKSSNCWFREMISHSFKVEEVFQKVVNFSLQDRDLILQGLVNFAFVLLGIGSQFWRDPIAEKQWQLGNMILLKIIKGKRQTAPSIIQTISNRIVTSQNVSHYIEFIYILSKNLPLLMLENQSCVVELMESLVQISGSTAVQLLDALVPLTKVSPTIRDHLILLLRKSLYSRSTETRQVAVKGFLKLLTHLKISNMAVLSQSSTSSGSFSSGHSLFTQISLNRTSQSNTPSSFSNEALCLEMLSILKRCFMQQVEVRSKLYEGLYEAVCLNPELGVPILNIFWVHFSEFYVLDDEVLPPLDFKKIVQIRDVDAILQEPLGKLVYAIGLITTKVGEIDDDDLTVIKFKSILNNVCEKMISSELIHFELDDGTDLQDILPESQLKVHILKEVMNVYEALIGYKIYSWDNQSENQGQTINSLFQGYNRLLHFSKNLSKPKKGSRTKKDANRSTQMSANSSVVKKKDNTGAKPKTFKVPETVLDFQCIIKALNLLHMPEVSWTSAIQANTVKSKRDLHRHFMQACIQQVQKVKSNKYIIDTNISKVIYYNLCDVASILYIRIVKRLNDFIDFDCATAVLALECFQMIFSIIVNQYKSNFGDFLSKVGVIDKDKNLVDKLEEFVGTYQNLFEMEEDETVDDPEIKKISGIVLNTLNLLAGQIPPEGGVMSIKLFDWLKTYSANNTLSTKLSTIFINLLFETHIKYKVSLTFFENLSINIGEIIGTLSEEETTNVDLLKIVNEGTVHNILLSLCNCIKSVLEDIDAIIVRLKSLYSIITYPGEDNVEKKIESLKNKERGVSCQLCFLVNILTNICNITIQPGNISEAVFKNVSTLFCTLSSFTKYFMLRSSKTNLAFQGARFERLVKLTGKQLAPVVYKLILHIEESQKQAEGNSQAKKRNVDSSTLKSRVLKETRIIPKVVYEIEQFSKCVIQLSNKTKVDLAKYVGQGTVRDFRILQLKEVLEQADGDNTMYTQGTEANTSVEESMDTVESNNEEEDGQEEDGDNESLPPPTKKSKK